MSYAPASRRASRATGAKLEGPGRRVRLSALGLLRDPHGSVKQIHHEELEDGDKKRPSAFPKIMLSSMRELAILPPGHRAQG
jgi:hypothetical protein